MAKNSRLPVFVSYAHEDQPFLDHLLTFLKPLEMQDQVCAWSDREIRSGSEWPGEIENSIGNARAAILLVSEHFLASEFIRNSEIPRLLHRRDNNRLIILPVIVRECLFNLAVFPYNDGDRGKQEFRLSSLKSMNPPDEPLANMSKPKRNKVFAQLALRLHEIWTGV